LASLNAFIKEFYNNLSDREFSLDKLSFRDFSFDGTSFRKLSLDKLSLSRKSIVLASTCAVSAFAIFFISSGSDDTITNVSAQDSKEIITSISEDAITDENMIATSKVNMRDIKFPTLSVNGQQFATDGKIISEKLTNYDFYNNGEKVVYLTFDDGPTKYTKDILEVLKKYNIRATFFPTGTAIENGGKELQEVLKESYTYGNSIGNHTYSHSYSELYPNGNLNLDAFNNDIERNLQLLKNAIGKDFETNIVRCPGGFSSWGNMNILDEQFKENGVASIDWNAITGDTSKKNTDVNSMLSTAVETSLDKNLVVLLMHETNQLTPEYLDKIIKYYHSNGYTFKTIA
jgi:peptidoglycan/xylan/chitin deacetylase (PgdA/CDA1 family)